MNTSRIRPTVLEDDYILSNGKWAEVLAGKKSKSYSVWTAMMNRCVEGGSVQKKRTSYRGCSISDNFKNFQFFCNWHRSQVGYNLNYHLDKDFLYEGNKEYSECSCVLLPPSLNCFIIQERKSKGNFPTGVHEKRPGTFVAQISLDGKQTHIGVYDSFDIAEKAYLKAKTEEAGCWLWRILDGEFTVDTRVIDRLKVMSGEYQ